MGPTILSLVVPILEVEEYTIIAIEKMSFIEMSSQCILEGPLSEVPLLITNNRVSVIIVWRIIQSMFRVCLLPKPEWHTFSLSLIPRGVGGILLSRLLLRFQFRIVSIPASSSI